MRDPNCIFCKIVAGEIPSVKVWEDDKFMAFLDIKPIELGHTLLIPKEHHGYLFDMPDDIYSSIWLRAKELAPRIQSAAGSSRIGIAYEGISVPHVHIHIIPINKVGDVDPNRAKDASTEELAEMAVKIKTSIDRASKS